MNPTRLIPWPLLPTAPPRTPRDLRAIGEPRMADGGVNYSYLDCGEWWRAEGKEAA